MARIEKWKKHPRHNNRNNNKNGDKRMRKGGVVSSRQKNSRKHQRNNRSHAQSQSQQAIVVVSENSIHRAWKQPLGGLIRYYIHTVGSTRNVEDVNRQIEQIYISNGCNVKATRNDLIRQLCQSNNDDEDSMIATKSRDEDWIQVQMGIENTDSTLDHVIRNQSLMCDGGGIQLETVQQPAEGIKNRGDVWNVVQVEPWAIGKPFYLQITNKSPLHLSCSMSIDGHPNMAKNSPIEAYSTRTIRPDNSRYFQTHQWILQSAHKIKFSQLQLKSKHKNRNHTQPKQEDQPQSAPLDATRYNNATRLSITSPNRNQTDFPDPSQYGWTFTGTSSTTSVEFFEKQLNLGKVYLDYNVVQKQVKTVLHHPATGHQTLFQSTLNSSLQFLQILQNPRAHVNTTLIKDEPMSDTDTENNKPDVVINNNDQENDTTMQEEKEDHNVVNHTYLAKNENYNFATEGHENRMESLAQLEKSSTLFRAWKEAEQTDWACIHFQFHVSIPHKKYDRSNKNANNGRKKKVIKKEHVPKKSTKIPDIKSAESATLSTKFHILGKNHDPPKQRLASRVKMERIRGLTDDPDWGSGPVFEYKLYYRCSSSSSSSEQESAIEENEGDDGNDGEMNAMEEDERPLSDQLLLAAAANESSLEEYKLDIIQQINGLQCDNMATNVDEANTMLTNCMKSITDANNISEIDDAKIKYYMWYQKQSWSAK